MTSDELDGIDTKKMTSAIGNQTVGTAGAQITGANLKRRALRLFSGSTGPIWVHTQPLSAVGTGILLVQSAGGLLLTAETDGELVCQAWYGIGSNANDLVSYVTINDGT